MGKKKLSADDVNRAADILQQTSTGLLLTGKIRNGKLKLDKATQKKIQKRFPKADRAFVALNSPFDHNSQGL